MVGIRGKILLLTGIFCILLLGVTNADSATWWDDNWNYRKQVDIANNVNTTLYNYSMNISLNTAELISQGKMQNDCGDIRIIENGEEINYGIKNCNSDNTEIYFRANDLVIGNNNDIYIYYGNSDATNGFVPNWKDAFYIWYDDFNTDRGWDNCPGNTKSGTVTVDTANSWLYASYGSYTDYHVCPTDESSFPMDGRVGFKAETRIMAENDRLCQIQVMLGDSSYSPKISIPNFRVGHNDYTLLWSDWVSKDLHDDVWYETTAVYNRLTGAWYAEFADDGVKSGTRTAQPDDDFSTIMLDICNGINMYLDYIYLRYFIEPEPSYYLGGEEIYGEAILYDRDGDIYVANLDGSNEKQLTSGTPIDYMPSISPDGTTIAFSRDYDLYLMDYDGSNQRLLMSKSDVGNNNVHDSDWTLDGEWIYFDAVSGCCSGGLYKVRPDGTNLTQVKSGYVSGGMRIRRSFGDRVIFNQRRSHLSYSQNVRITDLDGGNEEQVTGGGPSESSATFGTCWSPNGQRFAYNYGHQHIYVASYPSPYNPVEVKTFGTWNSHSLEWLDNNTLIWVDEQNSNRMYTINVDTLVETDLGINGQNPYVGKYAIQNLDLVYVDPSYKKTVVNRNFTIDVSIDSINEVYATHVELYFNSTILNALSVAEGDFLKKDGANTFSVIDISNDEGKITFANTRFGVDFGVTGDGTLASITFKALYGGMSDLDLKNIELSDTDFESIPVLTEDGIVEVRLLGGDVDNNCVVNIFDLARVGKAYGKQPGDPDWNTDADLTGDGIINIFDLATVGLNYGRTC